MEKRPFYGRLWPDCRNTARADMAGLGSIGLNTDDLILSIQNIHDVVCNVHENWK